MLFLIISSIIIVPVFSFEIYKTSKINSEIQSNIKNIVNTISEDISQNNIIWISKNSLDKCSSNYSWNFKFWNKLCTSQNQYFIAQKINWNWIRMSNISNNCLEKECFLVKKDSKWLITPITKNNITFDNFTFYFSNDSTKKVTINFTIKSSKKELLSINSIEKTKVIFQTTINEKFTSKK